MASGIRRGTIRTAFRGFAKRTRKLTRSDRGSYTLGGSTGFTNPWVTYTAVRMADAAIGAGRRIMDIPLDQEIGDFWWRLLGVLLLLAANGLFVAIEFALVSSRRSRVEALIDADVAGARAVLRLLEEPDRVLAAAQLGITDAVTFHGHVDDAAKHALVQRSWVHILPSRKEGWGLAVIEAAQHGVPTIGYRSSGGLTDSIVDGVTGVLVDDHHDLVDRLEQLLGDPVLRAELGAKAQARSREFTWQQSAAAMLAVLESVHAGTAVSGVIGDRGYGG